MSRMHGADWNGVLRFVHTLGKKNTDNGGSYWSEGDLKFSAFKGDVVRPHSRKTKMCIKY